MQKYAIIDIETTGGYRNGNQITEIAILVTDGKQLIDEFSSLVNPESYIPPTITSLTGITNEMVADAPRFFEIAKEIQQVTEDCVFVAHNVGFDYSFVRQAFADLGFNYVRKKLCTVRMSRKAYPGLPSYSLGNLCHSLGIPIENRHRAGGDAAATLELFHGILAEDESVVDYALNRMNREAILPPHLKRSAFDELPEGTGVYYFHNQEGKTLYVGKAKNIRKRILSHFTNQSKHKQSLYDSIYDISFELTGSELVALLLESAEIKRLHPHYNKAQRFGRHSFALVKYLDQKGYLRLAIERLRSGMQPIATFKNLTGARDFLYRLKNTHRLCPKFCGLQSAQANCFDYSIHQCQGACIEEEDQTDYNQRVEIALEAFGEEMNSYCIQLPGRNSKEKALVQVEDGQYKGWGYVDANVTIGHWDDVEQHIQPQKDNRDIQRILAGFLRKASKKQVIEKAALTA